MSWKQPFYWTHQRKWDWNIETQTRTPFPIIKPLCEGRTKVVYGNKYQGNFGYNQCVCMALTAIAVSSTSTPANHFNGVTIDYILETTYTRRWQRRNTRTKNILY